MNLDIGKDSKRVALELRYEEITDRWYMTLTDIQTEECYFSMIPLLASYNNKMNNLWEPFAYKGIGILWCFPKNDNPSSENPSRNNINEFWIIWGDGLE